MKRIALNIITLAIFSIGCMAAPITPAVSRQAAANFWNTYRPADVKAVDAGQMQQVDVADLPMLHIWAVGEEGFVIMSASDVAIPVLAYSFNSQATRNPNPEVRFWLNQYNAQIAAAEAAGLDNSEAAAAWQSLLTSPIPAMPFNIANVPELMQTRWDQGDPYNKYCPYDSNYHARTVVGCVATAMAQIMKYWNHPSSGVGYHSYSYGCWDNIEANFGQTTYMWDIMENRLDNFTPQRAIKPVATISYHCGVAVDMMYGPASLGGSGAYTTCGWWTDNCAESAFRDYFKYNPDLYTVQRNTVVWRDSLAIDTATGGYVNVHYRVDSAYIPDSVWCRMIDSNLALNAPLYYSGRDTTGGHAFVLDGSDLDGRYHFNWGWNGSYNGFYGINDVAPRAGGIGSNSTHVYNSEQYAMFRILPLPEHFDSATVYDTICRDMNTYTFHDYNFTASNDDTVYTAIWLDTVFTIHLTRIAVRRLYVNPNGGNGTNYEIKFCPSDGVVIPECRYTRENCIFLGWGFNPYHNDTLYQAGDVLHLYTSQTIYAIWRDTINDPPVGIDVATDGAPIIAPNPTINHIDISLDDAEDVTVNVIDSYGRVVIQRKAIGGKAKITLDRLPSGSYTVQIVTSDTEYKQRIIKL